MSGAETKRPRWSRARPVRSEWALIELAGSVSPVPDGERVSVVGEDRPSGPDLLAFVAFQAGSVQAVAAFEVTDPSFGTGSVALQPSLGAFGAGLLAAGDEHPIGRKVFDGRGRRANVEAAIESDLFRGDPEPLQFRDGRGQERVLARVPDRGCGRHDQPASATLGVLRDLRDLRDIPELVRLCRYPHSRTYAETATMPTPATGWW